MPFHKPSPVFSLTSVLFLMCNVGLETTRQGSRPDLCDVLMSQDFVCKATIVNSGTIAVGEQGLCGGAPQAPERRTRFTLKVRDPLMGSMPVDTITLTVPDVLGYASDAIRPGVEVVAWGYYKCSDGGRIWGNIAIVTPEGHLRTDGGRLLLTPKMDPATPLTLNRLRQCLDDRSLRDATKHFVGKRGIALLRVRDISQIGKATTYTCDSLGWILAPSSATPRCITVEHNPVCARAVQPGDTLAFPVSVSERDTVSVRSCIAGYRLVSGIIPALGVARSQATRAIEITNRGIRLRRAARRTTE